MKFSRHNYDRIKNDIILENNTELKRIGSIDNVTQRLQHTIITSHDFVKPEELTDEYQINIHIDHFGRRLQAQIFDFRYTNTGITTAPEGDLAFVKHVMNHQGLTIVNSDEDHHYTRLLRLAALMSSFFSAKPVYANIMENGKLVTILDLIFKSENADKYISQILFTNGNVRQIVTVCERILSEIKAEKIYNPITQEEQVTMFLETVKQNSENVEELVSDKFIETLKENEAYSFITSKLDEAGYKLSETQQFNSLQHTGLVLNNKARIMYNLSDMGAGKTLMTVQSIMYAQKFAAQYTAEQLKDYDTSNLVQITLPAINIVAPTLSLKSSWLKTFEIFVDLEKVDDNQYKYEMREGEYTMVGFINLVGFTVKNGSVHVTKVAPISISQTNDDYLVIDEIHQLLHRPLKADKFIAKKPNTTINIHNQYRTFVLSGTLANLNTTQWFNMVQMLGIPDEAWGSTCSTAAMYSNTVDSDESTLKKNLADMAENIIAQQNREFDEVEPDNLAVITQPKLTSRERLFHLRFGTSILNVNSSSKDLANTLINKRVSVVNDPSVLPTPNFELFYKLVSNSVVTAQSIQIATELFGEQATQHNAQVIKTKSSLTQKDLELLRRLHRIVEDMDIYKSPVIATNIANAILNLNDGLNSKTIYDVLNASAKKSNRFLEYLTKMDLSLLEDITSSNLIHTPELEETEKFKILKDILQREKDETFLIVVNTPEVAIKLAKTLGVKSLTTKEMKDELNYQDVIDKLYTKQNIAIVPQHMIKSSLDLVQANRLIQYQLNIDISDIIQTQNRINRIGQTRETKAYYIATDVLQENIIELFLETYRNIKVAHKGIVELFVDMEKQIDVISDYLANALDNTVIEEVTEESVAEKFFIQSEGVEKTEINPNEEALATFLQNESDVAIWFQNFLLIQGEDNKSVILAEMEESKETPIQVQVICT